MVDFAAITERERVRTARIAEILAETGREAGGEPGESTDYLLAMLIESIEGLRADLRASAPQTQRTAPSATPQEQGGACFGAYGRSKGQPVSGATMADLEYYASGCRRTLADSSKARFHDKERVLLAAIEAEISRQKGGGQGPSTFGDPPNDFGPSPDDNDIPFVRTF